MLFRLRKVWEICLFTGIVAVFPLALATYVHFTVPKFKTGDCFRFKYNDNHLFKVTSVGTYRYRLNNSMYLGFQYVDKNARKVNCEKK